MTPDSYRISVARHAAYVDALIDHTLRRDHGARSAFIRQPKLREEEWIVYRDEYERRFGQLCESDRALDILRRAGAL